jgi:protein ImuB
MSFACVHIPNFLLQAVVRGDGLRQDFSSGVETPEGEVAVMSELKLRPPKENTAAVAGLESLDGDCKSDVSAAKAERIRDAHAAAEAAAYKDSRIHTSERKLRTPKQDFPSGVKTPGGDAAVMSELKLRPPEEKAAALAGLRSLEQSFAASGRAVAVVDGTPPLCRVVAANAEAWQAGVHMGMTKAEVEKFCTVEVRQRSHAQEAAAHAALMDLGWSFSPRVEDAAPETIVIDIEGLGSLFGSEEKIAEQIAARARDLQLSVNVAVAAQIEAAILAARGFSGITVIPEGEEAACLGRLPVAALSPPLEILEILERWGIETCAALAALPVVDLSERLGQEGVRLHELARGGVARSMVAAQAALLFEEAIELEDAVADLEPLAFIFGRLLGQLCARLEARALAAAAIRLRMDLESSFSEETGKAIPASVYEKTFAFPVPLRDPKTLLRLLRLHLQSDSPVAPAAKVSIAADFSAPRTAQNGLFSRGAPDPEKLELTLARLAHLVGEANVGSAVLVDTHRPDEFQMSHFALPVEQKKSRHDSRSDGEKKFAERELAQESGAVRTASALRVFRLPLAARVSIREGRPARVTFRGVSGEVVAASGPWRTSGEWWRKDAWRHDEWDLEIRAESEPGDTNRGDWGHGEKPRERRAVYRVFYDATQQKWFVRGVYD